MILVGKDFWDPFLAWMRNVVLDQYHAIGPEDFDIVHVVDSAEEAFEIIHKSPIRTKFG
jgi:hypothetical protein